MVEGYTLSYCGTPIIEEMYNVHLSRKQEQKQNKKQILRDHLPSRETLLIVGNHTSLLDWVAKSDLAHIPSQKK